METLFRRTSLTPTTTSLTRCGVVWRDVLWCGGMCCGVTWLSVVWCGMVWCGVV